MSMKRSSLFYCHQQSGAGFTEHQGWEIPAFFLSPEKEVAQVRDTVGLSDQSYLLKFDLKERPMQGRWLLGANHYLLMGEPPMDAPLDAIDVSSVYTSLRLAGPRSRESLARLTSVNVSDSALPNLQCVQTLVAHAHAIVMREDIGSTLAFHLLISREFGESVWESVIHAGREFNLCPFGLTALRLLHN